MKRVDHSNLEEIGPEILACASALSLGRIDEARMHMERFRDYQHPLAKAVASRVFLYEDDLACGRQFLLDAVSLLGESRGGGNDYIREYAKVFLLDFSSKEALREQIRVALDTNPSASVLACLPLFEDLDFVGLGIDSNLRQ